MLPAEPDGICSDELEKLGHHLLILPLCLTTFAEGALLPYRPKFYGLGLGQLLKGPNAHIREMLPPAGIQGNGPTGGGSPKISLSHLPILPTNSRIPFLSPALSQGSLRPACY